MTGTGFLPVGSLVRDSANGRVGVYMGSGGPHAMVRPVCGGQEWEADPGDLQPAVSAYPRPLDVEQLRAAYRFHLGECERCSADGACDIGRALSLACEEAEHPAEVAPPVTASGVMLIPAGEPVPPCPFPCSICRAEGRQ
jgi:hypothetical protein